MSLSPYKLPWRRLLFIFALLIFSLLVFQPTQQTRAARAEPCVPVTQGLAGRVATRGLLTARPSASLIANGRQRVKLKIPTPRGSKQDKMKKVKIVADLLFKSGPIFPAVFNMSDFKVQGLVQGDGWLIAIDYELEAESTAEVTITMKDVKQPFIIQLPPTNDQRNEITSQIPEQFGKKPQVGEFTFRAFKNGPGERKDARFFLYGLAVGRKGVAVGSILVDQLKFQPSSIRSKLKEKAFYSFRALSDFDTASAEFFLVQDDAYGVFRPQRIAIKNIKSGVRRNESVTDDWDGKNSKGKFSMGGHQFHVRVWRGLKSGGDWVSAAVKDRVRVE